MKTLSTTPHENPRALYAFSAKGSSALNKYHKSQATLNI